MLTPLMTPPSEGSAKDQGKYKRVAGTLFFVAGLQWLMLVIAAELLFPNYSIMSNDLSDLASTVSPNASPVQPSATMFNVAMAALGLMVIVGAYFIHLGYRRSYLTLPLGIFGVGSLLVSIFPGDTGNIHAVVALIAFIFGPISAIAAYKVAKPPLSYVFALACVIALVPLFTRAVLGDASPLLTSLGRGGEERMIAYPVLAWLLAFGGSLVGSFGRD